MTEQQQSYYEYVKANDIVGHLSELFRRGGFQLRQGDGMIHCEQTTTIDTPWHHVRHDEWLDCGLWHRVMFDFLSQQLPGRFVPSRCQECWKVVVRPRTVVELFALLDLQKRLDRPSKCGIEIRPTVHGNYGGYFYCRSLEDGMACYTEVRAAIDADSHLGPDIGVLLKRACTEYEMACGPSDKWQISEAQLALEALVEQTFVPAIIEEHTQPDHLIRHVHARWIEHAYSVGDPTYLHLTNDKPLYPRYVTYHDRATGATAAQAAPEE